MDIMDLEIALNNIEKIGAKYAQEEVLFIKKHKDEAIPTLLENVKNVSDRIKELPEDYEAHLYAMFLLAEFKVKSSFEYLIKYLEFSKDESDCLLGDILTEDFGAILASVATINDIPSLKLVIQNGGLDEFQRSAALTSLVTMYVEGVYSRADLFEYMGFLLEEYRNEPYFNTLVVCDCINVDASEHFEYIKQLFEDSLIDEGMIDIDDFYNEIAGVEVEGALLVLKDDRNRTYVTDTIKSMSWWACFREPQVKKKKIGRNEQCPCGSGKKSKKCCGS